MNKSEVFKLDKIIRVICWFIFFTFCLFLLIRIVKINNSLSENKYITIGRVCKYETQKGRDDYDYFYYYNQNKIENSRYSGEGDENNSVGKFYVLKLSTEHPEYSEIDLDQEVIDTVDILKAGFSSEDIKN